MYDLIMHKITTTKLLFLISWIFFLLFHLSILRKLDFIYNFEYEYDGLFVINEHIASAYLMNWFKMHGISLLFCNESLNGIDKSKTKKNHNEIPTKETA